MSPKDVNILQRRKDNERIVKDGTVSKFRQEALKKDTELEKRLYSNREKSSPGISKV